MKLLWTMRGALLSAAILFLVPVSALAESDADQRTSDQSASDEVELEVVKVEGGASDLTAPKRQNEVTGLGKIVRDSDQLDKEQVLGIRDLTRYTPGISVVEQGQGASSGYSIRGVDQNRVSILVDGVPQIQTYMDPTIFRPQGGSGAMNEIEYENISSLEISKGSSSAQSGSGAMGGSVSLTTKDVDDFLLKDKQHGFFSKTSYSSKDNRKAQTLGGAFRTEKGVEGLLQYTYRTGNEISIHPDAQNTQQTFRRLGAFEKRYELRRRLNPAPNTLAYPGTNQHFYSHDQCSGGVCQGKQKSGSAMTAYNDLSEVPNGYLVNRPLTAEEQAQLNSMIHPTETVSAKDYTGANRISPNPMEYDNKSLLARLGYRFSPKHYVGVLLEDTRQTYDIRDMTMPAYYRVEDKDNPDVLRKDSGINPSFNFHYNEDGLYRDNLAEGARAELQWSRTHFIDERHKKKRFGFMYRYQNDWDKQFELTLDHQLIGLDTFDRQLGCAPYPYADKNCRASSDKPGSWEQIKDTFYREEHDRVNAKFSQWMIWGGTEHNTTVTAGFDQYESSHSKQHHRLDYIKSPTDQTVTQVGSHFIYTPNSYAYQRDFCQYDQAAQDRNPRCEPVRLNGYNAYLGLRHTVSLFDWVDLGANIRVDKHTIESDDAFIRDKTYHNTSWGTGVVFKPTSWLRASYKIASGFRVPSFQEAFGTLGIGQDGSEDWEFKSNLAPETSKNHEFGLTLQGEAGFIELSYYIGRYRDMIAKAQEVDDTGLPITGTLGLHNVHNIDVSGFNIDGVWRLAKSGLSVNASYGQSSPDKISMAGRFYHVNSYPLDTIQPPKMVLGVNYDAPNGRFGSSLIYTHSWEKDPNDLKSKFADYEFTVVKQIPPAWTTFDLVAYVKPFKNITVRGGIYNLLNYRYSTWESVRQTSFLGTHWHNQKGNYLRYAATGRNFVINLEAKF